MSWIKVEDGLLDHPKTYRLMSEMGWTKDRAVLNLLAFWQWAAKYADDGDLRRFGNDAILFNRDLPSQESSRFLGALAKVGFIDQHPYIRIHDWLERAHKYLYAKYHTANPRKLKAIVRKIRKDAGKTKDAPKDAPKDTPKDNHDLIRFALNKAKGKRSSTAFPPVPQSEVHIGPSPKAFSALPIVPTKKPQNITATSDLIKANIFQNKVVESLANDCEGLCGEAAGDPNFKLTDADIIAINRLYRRNEFVPHTVKAVVHFWGHSHDMLSRTMRTVIPREAKKHGYHPAVLVENNHFWYEKLADEAVVKKLADELKYTEEQKIKLGR